MHRRSFIRAGAISAPVLLAGCVRTIRNGLSPREVTVDDDTQYGAFVPVNFLRAYSSDSVDDGPTHQFEELSERAQLVFVSAVARQAHFAWRSSDIPDEELDGTVEFRGKRFEARYSQFSYSRAASLPDGWDPPVELTAERTDDELHLQLVNTSTEPIEVLYPDSPEFGVLVAFAPSDPLYLFHENYRTNPNISVFEDGSIVHWHTFDHFEPPSSRTRLPSGSDEALRSTYSVPAGITDAHTIQLQLPLLIDDRYSMVLWELSNLR